MAMFEKLIRFYGKHAYIMQKYCKDKGGEQEVPFIVSNNSGEEKNIYIFDNRVHIYLVGGMLGIIKQRTAEVDHSVQTYSSVMPEILGKQRANLMRMYHHMVLTENNLLGADAKIKEAFSVKKTDEEWEEQQKKLENYVRGGLEIIDEIFGKCKTYEDVCNAMFDLRDLLDLAELPEEE